MAQEPISISDEDMKESLGRSGYLLEARMEAVLRARSGYSEANSPYTDPITGKSRELDLGGLLRVEFLWDDHNAIFSRLLIECVNNPQPMAFFMRDTPWAGFQEESIHCVGIPVRVPDGERGVPLPRTLDMMSYHHYCTGPIATQYCSFVRKKDKSEWMAIHDEEQFGCISALCNAMSHCAEQHYRNYEPGPERVNIEFYYPILALQGELVEVRQEKGAVLLNATDHLRFQRSVSAHGHDRSYGIDVVTEPAFPKLLDLIEKELRTTAEGMKRRQNEMKAAIRWFESERDRRGANADLRDLVIL